MAQKYDLTDIGNALSQAMDNPVVEIIRSGTVGTLGIVNPVLGIAAGIGNDLLSKYNDFKLSYLLNGLASGCNLEKRLNQLYTYITSSSEKAINVANLFKQTVNAECPKACIIYGLIMATHILLKVRKARESTRWQGWRLPLLCVTAARICRVKSA